MLKRFLKSFCSKVIFISSSFLMLHVVAYYILDGKDVHCGCKFNNVVVGS
jgi:hypothetical protein